MSDEEEIQRLVDHLVIYGFDDEPKVLDEDSARRLREVARAAHAKWKANPKIEDVEVKLDDVRAGAATTSFDESFDGDELDEIFSGREAAERAEAVRLEKEWEKERDEREEAKRRAEAKETARSLWIAIALVLAVASGIAWVFLGKSHDEKHDKPDKNEAHHTEQR